MKVFARWALVTGILAVASSPTVSFSASSDTAAAPAKRASPKQQPERAQRFANAEQGMEAFAAAVKADDIAALRAILGPAGESILNSGDPAEDTATRRRFTAAYEESHKLEQREAYASWIIVGKDDWPLPIPLVKDGTQWYFDTNVAKEEVLNRRIGRNELYAIQAVRAYIDAQQEYYARNPQKDKLLHYAQTFVSAPNKRDGLYFPTKNGEAPSPLGPLFDARRAAGHGTATGGKPEPYHGYYYRILKSQGPKAGGGAYNYVVDGRMIGGFALVAYPAAYGNSGVMTFIVNHDGIVYQKDLGPNTAAIAQKLTRFDPDDTWSRQ